MSFLILDVERDILCFFDTAGVLDRKHFFFLMKEYRRDCTWVAVEQERCVRFLELLEAVVVCCAVRNQYFKVLQGG